MTEKLISTMDENFETTKNESRASSIGFLQAQIALMYPSLIEYENSFFFEPFYFEGEKVNEALLENGKNEFESLKQSRKEKTNAL